MRLVVDMQGAQSSQSRLRGIGRYSLSLVRELARQARGHEIILAVSEAFPEGADAILEAFAGVLPRENLHVFGVPGSVAGVREKNRARREAAQRLRETFLAGLRPDMVLVTSLFEGLADDAVTSIGITGALRVPTAVVFYDLIPYVYRDHYLRHADTRDWYLGKLDQLRRADLLLAISRFSAREARDRLGFSARSVVNIKSACEPHFRPYPTDFATRERLGQNYGLSGRFVLYTGGIDFRKNIEGLIAAYAALPPLIRAGRKLAVVCAMGQADRKRLETLGRQAGLGVGELVLTGYVLEDDLLALYNACELFVFPSRYEGFGLPVLEAMACGRPVIAANCSSLPEVVDDPEALFDPDDPAALTTKLAQALTAAAWRDQRGAAGLARAGRFSWAKTAARAWRAMERTVAEAGCNRVRLWAGTPRPRLAYVSPLPPQQSGISEYGAMLLPELSRHYAIDVVVTPDANPGPEITSICGVRSVEAFARQADRYDRVLYHFGNSRFHAHMFGLLQNIPGVVVLHDFFLSDIVASLTLVPQKDRSALSRSLYHAHGWPALIALGREARPSRELTGRFPANLDVIQKALGVLVHSEHARELAATWYGPAGRDRFMAVPLAHIAGPCPTRETAREALGIEPETLLVCSFGHVSEAKCSLFLLRAWLSSPLARDVRARLVFVGQTPRGAYGEAFFRELATAGEAAGVTATGWLDGSDYHRWLGAADMAVQLRTRSRGETSAAVLDCLGQGLATIVNRHGSLAEMPETVVYGLPDIVSEAELTAALTELAASADRRRGLGRLARAHVRMIHNPRACATCYREAIEAFYDGSKARQAALDIPARERRTLEAALERTFAPEPRRRQLLLDVSELSRGDFRTGVQRVVRTLLREFLLHPPAGFAVEPVVAEEKRPGYRYARKFASRVLDLPENWAGDDPVEVWPGDVFFGLDLSRREVLARREDLAAMGRRGARIVFLVYDLLPVNLPEDFPTTEKALHEDWLSVVCQGDGAICISRTVAGELAAWRQAHMPVRNRPFAIDWCHLGADIEATDPTTDMPKKAERLLAQIRVRPSLLVVGTLEPRKGHALALAALERLWEAGEDVNLVFVGRPRRTLHTFADSLALHPQWGQRLFWPHPASDALLEALYGACAGLLAVSRGEGFGLPLIEAASWGLPVIARDIPVFREVAGEHAFYFPAEATAVRLSEALSHWLALRREGREPASVGMDRLSWKQCAQHVLKTLVDRVIIR